MLEFAFANSFSFLPLASCLLDAFHIGMGNIIWYQGRIFVAAVPDREVGLSKEWGREFLIRVELTLHAVLYWTLRGDKSMSKIGKNTPCPCGSGKKYKACCGARVDNVIDLEARRWQVLADDLQQQMIVYANAPARDQTRYEALLEFFDGEEPEMDDYLWDRFLDWFLFDYHPEGNGGKPIIRQFREERQHHLDERSRELLERWEEAVISLYEVVEMEPGRGVTLKDLLRGGHYEVLDEDITNNVEKKSLLITRLLPVRQEYRFSMGATILPPFFKRTLLKEIRSDYEEYLEFLDAGDDAGWDAYLREWGFEIDAMVDQLGEDLPANETDPPEPSLPPLVEEFIRDLMLDEYYRQWIDKPIPALDGQTPREVIRSEAGRQRVEKVLRKMAAQGGREDAGDGPTYNVVKLRKMLGLNRPGRLIRADRYPWSIPEYCEVAKMVEAAMEKARFTPEQVANAIRLWYDFTEKDRPRFRKPEVWAAAVIYTLARIEFDHNFTQQKLAELFGVAPNGISNNYSRIKEALNLEVFDPRYCSLEPPVEGLEEFLAWLLH